MGEIKALPGVYALQSGRLLKEICYCPTVHGNKMKIFGSRVGEWGMTLRYGGVFFLD